MLDQHRNWFKGVERKAADIFAVLPLTPNNYTTLSIIAALAMLYFMLTGAWGTVIALFILSAGLDFIDGAVARRKNLSTNRGAYWDTIADRYVESITLFGLLFVSLPTLVLPSYAWIFLAFFGSLMTTYAKAAAKEKQLSEVEIKGGLMSRAERLAVIFGILWMLKLGVAGVESLLLALAVLTNITAIQRISWALKK